MGAAKKQEKEPAKKAHNKTLNLHMADVPDDVRDSLALPPEMKCEGCQAGAHFIYDAFANATYSNKKVLTTDDAIYEVIDEACSDKHYKDYMYKDVDEKLRLGGP